MPQPVQLIVDFVEGRLAPLEFEQLLYHDLQMQQLLQAEKTAAGEKEAADDVYMYLIQHDFSDPGDILTVHDVLARCLKRLGVAFQATSAYRDRYDMLLRVQPDWLNVDLNWLEQYVVPESGNRAGAELETWLRGRLLELFRCVGEAPEWIQDAEWPINENGPLVFLGQIAVCNYFHDEAAAYVFHDPTTGACETIIQVF